MLENNKAWLKLTYKQQTYIPVIILQGTSQFRSLIIDEGSQMDRKLAYYVDDNNLLPRSENQRIANLLQMEFINLPELLHFLGNTQRENVLDKKISKSKYIKIGSQLILNLKPQQFTKDQQTKQYLQKFYKSHINSLLANSKQKVKSIILFPKSTLVPHHYTEPLFNMLSENQQFWPYRIKIDKLNIILRKFLCNVNVEIKVGFMQTGNLKQSRKVMFVHLKPYIPVAPSQGLIVPQEIMSLANNTRFAQMYNGPKPQRPQNDPIQLQNVIDAFLSLGVQVRQIHNLMKLLSVIINLQHLSIQKQSDGGNNSTYTTFHAQPSPANIQNINKILNIEQDRLQNLFILGEYDQIAQKSLKQKQQYELFLQQLGTKQQVGTFRMHAFKYVIFEMLITQVCQILNKKLCSSDYVNQFNDDASNQNEQYSTKTLMIYSYINPHNISQNKSSTQKMQSQRLNSMFWNNCRQLIYTKIQQLLKSSIIAAIIGSGATGENNTMQKQQEDENDENGEQQQQKQLTLSSYRASKKKSYSAQYKRQHYWYKNIKKYLDYDENIQTYSQQMKVTEQNYQYKQNDLIMKQEHLHRIYHQVRDYSLITEISIALFKAVYRTNIIQGIPFTFYQYLWNNYDQFNNKSSINFSSCSSVITDSNYIIENHKFAQKIVDAIHKRKIFMQSQNFQKQQGNIQIGLSQFAKRYLYTKLCKQKIHKIYPKPMQKLKMYPLKSDKIKLATKYYTNQQVVEDLMEKIQMYIQKQQPQAFKLIMKKRSFQKQKFMVNVKSFKIFQQLEHQVENQYVQANKIWRQYCIYKSRENTLKTVHRIAMGIKLANAIDKTQNSISNKIGMKQIKQFYAMKLKKQYEEKKRLQQIRLANQRKFKKIYEYIDDMAYKRLGFIQLKIYNEIRIKIQEQQRIKREKQQQQRRIKQEQQRRIRQQQERKIREQEERKRKQQQMKRMKQQQQRKDKQQKQKQEKQKLQSQRIEKEKIQREKLQAQRLKQQQIQKQKNDKQKEHKNQIKNVSNSQILNHNNEKSNNLPQQNKQMLPTKDIKNQNGTNQNNEPVFILPNPSQTKENNKDPELIQNKNSNVTINNSNINPNQYTSKNQNLIISAPNNNNNIENSHQNQNKLNTSNNINNNNTNLNTNNSSQINNTNQSNINTQNTSIPAQTNHNVNNDKNKDTYSISIIPSAQSVVQQNAIKQPNIKQEKKMKQQNKVNEQNKKKQQNKMKQGGLDAMNPSGGEGAQHLSVQSKTTPKNILQYAEKSQNLQQLTLQQLKNIQDSPNFSLDQWQSVSKVKCIQKLHKNQQMFSKYVSVTEKPPAKPEPTLQPNIDSEIVQLFLHEDYLTYTRQHLFIDNQQTYEQAMLNSKVQLIKPLFQDYPLQKYPTLYKDAFNAILKIGYQKNTTKKLNQSLNVFVVPLYTIFYSQLEESKSKGLFDQTDMPSPDYSSDYNIIKDQIFFYFIKQISVRSPLVQPDKNYFGLMLGLSVLTRYFCPSPNFLYPFTHYIYHLHKQAINENKSEKKVDYLQSIYQNLLHFISANQQFKHNLVSTLKSQKHFFQIRKTQKQAAGYLYPRKTPISQQQINMPIQDNKPLPKTLTIRLINNQSFTFQIRNEVVKTIKKKVLAEIGMLAREKCFNLYFGQLDSTYRMIDDNEKALNLYDELNKYKKYNRERPLYIKLTYYFPFVLKDINVTRMVYMSLISDQYLMPFKGEDYAFLVAQSMAYDDYQEWRIGNYLLVTKQMGNKDPNMKPVQVKYKQLIPQVSKKICEFQYLKFMKNLGFLLIKCFNRTQDSQYVVGVKPFQIVFYQKAKKMASISIKRIKNVYLQQKKVILQIYYKGGKQQHERLRMYKIVGIDKYMQLFQTIKYYMENRLQTPQK